MVTTVKVSEETKQQLAGLDFATKGKSYDMIIAHLIVCYEREQKEHETRVKEWERSNKAYLKSAQAYQKATAEYEKKHAKFLAEEKSWDRLMIWAKKQGFKG